jgi:ribosome-binding ATPase YchF (GTP1/OBG family)
VVINRVLDKMGVRDPVDLGEWDEDQVKALVEAFLLVRFPTILLLNKADQVCLNWLLSLINYVTVSYVDLFSHTAQAGDTDKNISRIVERYEASKCFVASAGAECFLKICRQKNVIKYQAGASNFETIEDIEDDLDFRKYVFGCLVWGRGVCVCT